MTTGNTTLLGLALPVDGELDGTWGDVVNDSITSLVDSAVAGTTTLSTDADVTLTTTALSANQARQAIILWTASNGATTRNVTAPAQSKPYIVINAGTGSIVLRGAGPTTGVTVVAGEKCLAAWNGSDFVKVASSLGTGDVVGPASATDNAIARFDGTTGKLIQNSAVTVADTTGDITGGKYNKVTVTAPATSATLTIADGKTLTTNNSLTLAGTDATTMTFPSASASIGYLNIPYVTDKTTSYSLAVGDVGEVVGVGTGGSITIPDATFAAGDAVLIFNNTTGDITITCTITTAYIAGADADVASVTLATRGVCNILFISGTVCVITGNIS
jgi:hypothetical protein